MGFETKRLTRGLERRRVDCTTTICHCWGILLRMEELKAERERKGGGSAGTLHRVVGQLRQVIRHWIICCSGWSDKASKQMETRWQRGLLGRSTGGEWWWSQRWGIQVWGQQGEALKADLKRKVWWQQSGLLIDSDLEIYRGHRFDLRRWYVHVIRVSRKRKIQTIKYIYTFHTYIFLYSK